MRRRKLLAAVAVVVLALAGAAAFVLWPRPDRITEDSFERVREGMTRAEVYVILGPPGEYASGRVDYTNLKYSEVKGFLPVDDTVETWSTDSGLFLVRFRNDRVVASDHWRGRSENLRDKLSRWLERQWQKWFP